MPIPTRCQCGASFAAPDKLAGKKVKCPKCSEPVVVSAAGKADSNGAKIPVQCECGKRIAAPRQYAGKAIKCPACGAPLKVAAVTAAASDSRGGPDPLVSDLLDEVDLKPSATGHRCRNCRADMLADDIVCVQCGYNAETGKQLTTKTSKASNRDPQAAAIAAASQSKAKTEAPAPVAMLAKLLNQVGMLGVLAAIGLVGYQCYQAFTESTNFTNDQIIGVMTGTGGYVLGGVLVFVAVPCAIAANLVQEGKAIGRYMGMAMGFVGLVGLITTLPAILVLKLSFSDEVAEYCKG